MPLWIFGMLGSRFWYNSNRHNVCHGLWGYSEGHPLVNCRIPDGPTCKSSSASPIATAWWGTKRLFQLQWQPPPTRYMTFFLANQRALRTDLIANGCFKWSFLWGESSRNDLQSDVIYSPVPLTMRLGCPTYLAVAAVPEVVLWRPCLCDLGGAVSHWSVQTNQVRTDSQHYQGGQGAGEKTKKSIPTNQPTQTQQRIRNAEEFYF